MAKAQALAWLLAEKADFGMSPAMMASPTRWISGLQRRLEGLRIDRTPSRPIGETRLLGEVPGHLCRDDVGDGGLEGASRRLHRSALTSTASIPPVNWAGSHSIIPG